MIYQLPNGKIIRLSIEEYLEITDEDILYLISIDYGESSINPWSGSVLPDNSKKVYMDDLDNEEESSIDLNFFDSDESLDIPDDFSLD